MRNGWIGGYERWMAGRTDKMDKDLDKLKHGYVGNDESLKEPTCIKGQGIIPEYSISADSVIKVTSKTAIYDDYSDMKYNKISNHILDKPRPIICHGGKGGTGIGEGGSGLVKVVIDNKVQVLDVTCKGSGGPGPVLVKTRSRISIFKFIIRFIFLTAIVGVMVYGVTNE